MLQFRKAKKEELSMKQKYFKKFLTVLLILSVFLFPLQEKPTGNPKEPIQPFDIQGDWENN